MSFLPSIVANKSTSGGSSWVSSQNSSSRDLNSEDNSSSSIAEKGSEALPKISSSLEGNSHFVANPNILLENESDGLPALESFDQSGVSICQEDISLAYKGNRKSSASPTPPLSIKQNLVQMNKALYEAAQNGNLVSFNEAVEAGADIEYRSGETIYSNTNEQKKKGADRELGRDNTSLHILCFLGFMPIVMRLLELNAEINSTNSFRFSPLYFALVGGHPEVVRLLLDRGADLHLTSERNKFTPLHSASDGGHLEIASLHLHEDTPLHWASYMGHLEVARLLLDRGADLHLTSERNKFTPRHSASDGGHL